MNVPSKLLNFLSVIYQREVKKILRNKGSCVEQSTGVNQCDKCKEIADRIHIQCTQFWQQTEDEQELQKMYALEKLKGNH